MFSLVHGDSLPFSNSSKAPCKIGSSCFGSPGLCPKNACALSLSDMALSFTSLLRYASINGLLSSASCKLFRNHFLPGNDKNHRIKLGLVDSEQNLICTHREDIGTDTGTRGRWPIGFCYFDEELPLCFRQCPLARPLGRFS